MAKPLYEAVQGPDTELLLWNREQEKTFNDLKQGLTRGPTLRLPNLKKPFIFYMAEQQETALGVLIQKLGEVLQSIGDFSK